MYPSTLTIILTLISTTIASGPQGHLLPRQTPTTTYTLDPISSSESSTFDCSLLFTSIATVLGALPTPTNPAVQSFESSYALALLSSLSSTTPNPSSTSDPCAAVTAAPTSISSDLNAWISSANAWYASNVGVLSGLSASWVSSCSDADSFAAVSVDLVSLGPGLTTLAACETQGKAVAGTGTRNAAPACTGLGGLGVVAAVVAGAVNGI